ncbi:hypothetical protein COCNU_scaffold011978G000010 [Cocos nucifera]|nr:hypothetical protein [Cocos nucifera]
MALKLDMAQPFDTNKWFIFCLASNLWVFQKKWIKDALPLKFHYFYTLWLSSIKEK